MNARICWQCPNEATNPEIAPIGICSECFERFNELIEKVAKQGFRYEPEVVSYTEYKRRIKEVK